MKPAGWRERLLAYAVSMSGKPFAWSQTDCAVVVMGAVDAMIGGSRLTDLCKGRYHSAREARRLQRDIDARRALLDIGAVVVPARACQCGDVLIGQANGFVCAHICLSRDYSLASSPESGVALFSTHGILKAGAEVLRLA